MSSPASHPACLKTVFSSWLENKRVALEIATRAGFIFESTRLLIDWRLLLREVLDHSAGRGKGCVFYTCFHPDAARGKSVTELPWTNSLLMKPHYLGHH